MAAEQSQLQSTQQFSSLDDYQLLGNNYTVERKRAFLEAYREEGSIYHAAHRSHVSRKTVYNWIEHDEQFAEAVADCKDDAVVELEQSVYKRAFKSDLLAMFVLKAHRPQYRDKVTVDLSAVQEQINAMMERLELNPRQLQPATTSFIDTGYSEVSAEYAPTATSQNLPIPHLPEQTQKED